MTEDFEEQLKWFTKRLLQIRLLTVRGFSLPIPFELSDIENNGAVEFDATELPKQHLEDLVEEIRGYYIKHSEKSVSRDDIRIEYSEDSASAKIFGIDSDLLRAFLTGRLKVHTSLFEIRTAGVLFYVELTTGITLNATEQNILADFKSAKDMILSYDEIFEICSIHKRRLGERHEIEFRERNSELDKKNETARSTVSYLMRKMKESPLLEGVDNDKIIKNIPGTGYQLMM